MTRLNDETAARERLAEAWRRHERRWRDHRFVYAVVSRRSRGVSIGINLSPGKACNFACVYCQVRRGAPALDPRVDLGRLAEELDNILRAERDGSLYAAAPFDALLPEERGVRDIAFSGDGEPTAYPRFAEVVRLAAAARRRYELDRRTLAKLVLITNASYLDRPAVREALGLLTENNGEIWAKLDAGTEACFRQVNRARDVSLERITENILATARRQPLLIQSLWLRLRGEVPSPAEVEAYCDRLAAIHAALAAGGHLAALQLHTIVRSPAESYVAPLSPDELGRIAAAVRARLPIPVEVY